MKQGARKQKQELIELSVFERIAFSDLDTIRRAQSFLQKNGFEKASNQQDLAYKLAQAVDYLGEGSAPEFLSLHPDAHLFKSEEKTEVEQLEDCGCTGDDGTKTPAPKLQAPQQPEGLMARFNQQSMIQEYTPIILIAGFICVTITALSLRKN